MCIRDSNFTSPIQFIKEWFLSQGSPAGIVKVGSSYNGFKECPSPSLLPPALPAAANLPAIPKLVEPSVFTE
eukprot:1247419-Prorocentrum_lima.AAC.1